MKFPFLPWMGWPLVLAIARVILLTPAPGWAAEPPVAATLPSAILDEGLAPAATEVLPLPAPVPAMSAVADLPIADWSTDLPSTEASDLVLPPDALSTLSPTPAIAQTPPADTAPEEAAPTGDLAAASQNPIANLISVPFQNNTNFGVGPDNRTQNILNIQPVVPVPLSEDLILVTRTILPIVLQPDAGGSGSIFGLGDLNPTFFFVPVTTSNITLGVGPTVVLPTATDRQTGAGKWSAGPAGVVVVNSGQWVYGGLASQIWSFAGDGSRPAVSQFVLQPFVNYNLPNGLYLTSSPVITANWNAPGGEQFTVPIGGGVGKLFRAGSQPLNASLQLYWNAVRPTNGADFSLRAQLQFLFP